MGGSAKKARRRAAGPALRYAHVAGARTSGRRRPGKRKPTEEGEESNWLFGTLMFLAVLGVTVLFGLADLAWGTTLWGEIAPAWPGGGYGFAVTIGLLSPPALAGVIAPLVRAKRKQQPLRSIGWALAALPGVALSCLLLLLNFGATRPKRRRRGPECFAHGEPCWIHEQYPYLWAPGIAAVLCAALGGWLAHLYVKKRRARGTPPELTAPELTPPQSAAPSGPPLPDRPTCT
ncbi:hypothetical protein ABZ953_33775 [Streptomyces sp. NPDC046465]|uniref:hypothetical protein n=1 Tax=Streptomyces sp. NPDC046465 TaxID=3155810 RepID=UPI0033DDB74B